jgi:archaellum component FlaC
MSNLIKRIASNLKKSQSTPDNKKQKVLQWDNVPARIQRKIFNIEQDIDEYTTFAHGLSDEDRKKKIKELKEEMDRLSAPYEE